MKYRYLTFLLLFSAFSVLAQTRETSNFEGIEDIRLTTASGSAKIIKGSGNSVKVTLEYTYDEDDYEFDMEKRGTSLNLEETFRSNRSSGRSNWTLEIPDGLEVRFTTGSGNLEVDGLDLEIKSNLGSGSVLITDTKGYFRIATGSGDHEIDNHEGDLDLTTGSGDIEVSDASGDLEFTTGSGDITVSQVKGDVTASVGSGGINARNIELVRSGRFSSGSGDVKVSLNADTEASISLASGSGDAVLSFGGSTINATITMEASERYGRIIAPFEFDDEEIIERSGNNNNTIRKTVKLGNGKADIRIATGSGIAEVKK